MKAAAAAEARHGALRDADPAIYLNLGTGLAVAITSRGEVISGAHGASGEIGYCLRAYDDLAGAGSELASAPSVLEDVVSGMGLAAELARLADSAGVADPLAPPERASEIFRLADEDEAYRAIADRFSAELCFHLVNLAITVDPMRIAVGGGLARAWPHLEGPIRRALEAHVPYPPELVLGAYPFDAALRGAIDAGVDLHSSMLVNRRR